MSTHQGNQAAGTYQYQYSLGDQVVEIPSNINYQLENIIAAGGVSIDYYYCLIALLLHTSLCSFTTIFCYIITIHNRELSMNDRHSSVEWERNANVYKSLTWHTKEENEKINMWIRANIKNIESTQLSN
jgi:hypothetical protein